MSKKITVAKMLTFLDSKKPGETIGESTSIISCPIANFYREVFDWDNVWVYGGGTVVHSDRNGKLHKHILPEWAAVCIDKVDKEFGAVSAAKMRKIVINSIK